MTNVSEVHDNERKGTATDDREKRLDRVDELVYEGQATHAIARILKVEFDIAVRTAYQDIRDAAERRAPDEEAARRSLQDKAAEHWKLREWKADRAGKTQDANYAFDRWCKVKGAFSPKKIEITGSVSVGLEIDAVIGVLDAAGLVALELVMSQVEEARKSGVLKPAPMPLIEGK